MADSKISALTAAAAAAAANEFAINEAGTSKKLTLQQIVDYLGPGLPPSEVTVTTTGNINDLDFSNAALIRMNNASLATIRGLKAGTPGQRVSIVSIGAGQVDLSHQDTGDATAANRLVNFATSGKTPLAAGVGTATYQYDGTTARWRLVAHEQGAPITATFAAENFTGNGAMTWTVESADVKTLTYFLVGRQLFVSIYLTTTTVGGTLNNALQIALAALGGFTLISPAISVSGMISEDSGATFLSGILGPSGTQLQVYKLSLANFLATTNTTYIYGQIAYGVN